MNKHKVRQFNIKLFTLFLCAFLFTTPAQAIPLEAEISYTFHDGTYYYGGLNQLISDDDVLIAEAYGQYRSYIYTSNDNGTTWKSSGENTSYNIWFLKFQNGRYFQYMDSSPSYSTLKVGTNHSSRATVSISEYIDQEQRIKDVVFDANRYFYVTEERNSDNKNYFKLLYSRSNSSTIENSYLIYKEGYPSPKSIISGNNEIVVSFLYGGGIMKSSNPLDRNSWKHYESPDFNYMYWTGDYYIGISRALDYQSWLVYSSKDATNWKLEHTIQSNEGQFYYSGEYFLHVNKTGYFISKDGLIWDKRDWILSNRINSIRGVTEHKGNIILTGSADAQGAFTATISKSLLITDLPSKPIPPKNFTLPTGVLESGTSVIVSFEASPSASNEDITYFLEKSYKKDGAWTEWILDGVTSSISKLSYIDTDRSLTEIKWRVCAYNGKANSDYIYSSTFIIKHNEAPILNIIEPLSKYRVGDQDTLNISGIIKDENIGDAIKIKYSIEDTENLGITLTQPLSLISNGQWQSFQGYIKLDSLGSGNYNLKLWAEDDKLNRSGVLDIEIIIFNTLEGILNSLESYVYKEGEPQLLVVNSNTTITQNKENDRLSDRIKQELRDKNVKLFFIGKGGDTENYIKNLLE